MEAVLNNKVWVPVFTPFKFTEKVNQKTGQKSYILSGLMLPFDKVSRNNVLYNKGSIEEKHKDLIGRPLMYNHQTDGAGLPFGHFVDSYLTSEGWMYKADIDPEEKTMIRKLERGDLRHVSIQVIGGKVVERFDEGGNAFTEAFVSDVIEGSLVPCPGFLDTTTQFVEAFGEKKEDVTTTTGKGAIQPAKIVKKDDEEEESLSKEEKLSLTEDLDNLLELNDLVKI